MTMTRTCRLLVVAVVLSLVSSALAATKEIVTIDFAVKGDPITHKAAGFGRGLTFTEPPQEMLASLHPVLFRQPSHDTPAKYSALAIYPRARSMNATVMATLSDGLTFDG